VEAKGGCSLAGEEGMRNFWAVSMSLGHGGT
jgi:hypothetical protein